MEDFQDDNPRKVQVRGKDLHCLLCGNTSFKLLRTNLPSAGASLMGTEWGSPAVNAFGCTACGFLHLFQRK